MRLMINERSIVRQEVEHADVVVIELKPGATVAIDVDRHHKDTYILKEDDTGKGFVFSLADKNFSI